MNGIKRTIVTGLAAVAVVGLAGCSGSGSAHDDAVKAAVGLCTYYHNEVYNAPNGHRTDASNTAKQHLAEVLGELASSNAAAAKLLQATSDDAKNDHDSNMAGHGPYAFCDRTTKDYGIGS